MEKKIPSWKTLFQITEVLELAALRKDARSHNRLYGSLTFSDIQSEPGVRGIDPPSGETAVRSFAQGTGRRAENLTGSDLGAGGGACQERNRLQDSK